MPGNQMHAHTHFYCSGVHVQDDDDDSTVLYLPFVTWTGDMAGGMKVFDAARLDA